MTPGTAQILGERLLGDYGSCDDFLDVHDLGFTCAYIYDLGNP